MRNTAILPSSSRVDIMHVKLNNNHSKHSTSREASMVIDEVILTSIVNAIIGYVCENNADKFSERLRDRLGLDPIKKSFNEALGEAFEHLQKKYPQWIVENFDE